MQDEYRDSIGVDYLKAPNSPEIYGRRMIDAFYIRFTHNIEKSAHFEYMEVLLVTQFCK